jgi:serine protease Do
MNIFGSNKIDNKLSPQINIYLSNKADDKTKIENTSLPLQNKWKWENVVVKITTTIQNNDFNHPLNKFDTLNISGTGFFIAKNLILTCYHVIEGAININISYKQRDDILCKIVNLFPDDDIAVIKIIDDELNLDYHLLELKIINEANKITNDITVYAIGYPLSSKTIKTTKGSISGYQDSLLQTDAALNSGNSGGPLVILDTDDNYKIIGINVSKKTGDAEKTGYAIPIYRFINIWKNNYDKIIIRRPLMLFDYQPIIQDELKSNIFGNENKKNGIIITLINKKYYLSKYINEGDVLVNINNCDIDNNGYIKFDFYPEKISIQDIGLWFKENDEINFGFFDSINKKIFFKKFNLEIIKTNLLYYNNIPCIPNTDKYYVENNGLVLSIITNQHFKKLKDLDLSLVNIIKIFSRFSYHYDIFTVYLVDLDYSKIKKNGS